MTETTDLRNPTAVCAVAGLDAPDIWRNSWPQSARSFEPGRVFFLEPEYVADTCATLGIAPELTAALRDCAAAVAQDLALQRLVWHLHWLLSLSGLEVGSWPAPPLEAHPANALLYGLVVLAGVPRLLQINGARGVAVADTIETLSDLETWATDYHTWEGVYRLHTIGWLQHPLRGRLFKLARLEFLPGAYGHPFRWFREAGSGQVIALAESDLLLRPDGQFASADGGRVREGLWKSQLVVTPEAVTGQPVSPWGHVLSQTVTLDTATWHEVLRPGDPVITVHIPSKGRMGPEECGAAFVQAVALYRDHFPEIATRAFTCHSWLLDPQFEQLDPAPGNICAFLREWYLHPAEGADDRQHWQRTFDLFGDWQPKWLTAEPKSSLQRALVEFVKAGGRPRSGASVLFAEDLDWGQQVYRTTRKASVIS